MPNKITPRTNNLLEIIHFKLGWLLGVEPRLGAPQAHVLPLHHSHHVFATIAKKSRKSYFELELAKCSKNKN